MTCVIVIHLTVNNEVMVFVFKLWITKVRNQNKFKLSQQHCIINNYV